MFFLRFGASGKGAPTARDIRIMYKILTGNTLDVAEEENAEVTDIGVNALLEVDIGETRRGGKDQETEPKIPHQSGEMVFSCSDRNIVIKYAGSSRKIESKKNSFVLDDLPPTGTIYSGTRSKGITTTVKKEIKTTGSKLDLQEKVKKARDGVVVPEAVKELEICSDFCLIKNG